MSDDRGQIRFVGNKKSESQNSLIYPIHIPIIILRSCRTINRLSKYITLIDERGLAPGNDLSIFSQSNSNKLRTLWYIKMNVK